MELSIIPWQVFIETLHKQQSGTVELWLRSWLFSNEGVMLADESCATTDYSSVLGAYKKFLQLQNGWDESRIGPTKAAGTRWSRQSSHQAKPPRAKRRNHPLAIVGDRTEIELCEPCSRNRKWKP